MLPFFLKLYQYRTLMDRLPTAYWLISRSSPCGNRNEWLYYGWTPAKDLWVVLWGQRNHSRKHLQNQKRGDNKWKRQHGTGWIGYWKNMHLFEKLCGHLLSQRTLFSSLALRSVSVSVMHELATLWRKWFSCIQIVLGQRSITRLPETTSTPLLEYWSAWTVAIRADLASPSSYTLVK